MQSVRTSGGDPQGAAMTILACLAVWVVGALAILVITPLLVSLVAAVDAAMGRLIKHGMPSAHLWVAAFLLPVMLGVVLVARASPPLASDAPGPSTHQRASWWDAYPLAEPAPRSSRPAGGMLTPTPSRPHRLRISRPSQSPGIGGCRWVIVLLLVSCGVGAVSLGWLGATDIPLPAVRSTGRGQTTRREIRSTRVG